MQGRSAAVMVSRERFGQPSGGAESLAAFTYTGQEPIYDASDVVLKRDWILVRGA